MEVKLEEFLKVRQDGVRSWCFFAANGSHFIRTYGGIDGTGHADLWSFREKAGFVDYLISQSLDEYKFPEVEVSKEDSKKNRKGKSANRARKHFEYGLIALWNPSEAGVELDDVVVDTLSQSVRENASDYMEEKWAWHKNSGYNFARHYSNMSSKTIARLNKNIPVEGAPLLVPGVGIYQTAIYGKGTDSFRMDVFAKAVSKLARFCRLNMDCEVRVDMPRVPDELADAVMGVFHVLPSNAVIIQDSDSGYYEGDPDFCLPPSPTGFVPTGVRLNNLEVVVPEWLTNSNPSPGELDFDSMWRRATILEPPIIPIALSA